MNKDNKPINPTDDDTVIREMMRSTKKQASENLNYRIMHQIDMEAALTRKAAKPQKRTPSALKDLLSIFGWMYAVLALLTGGAYIMKGKEFLQTSSFIWMAIFVAFIFSSFWAIARIDAYVQMKRRK